MCDKPLTLALSRKGRGNIIWAGVLASSMAGCASIEASIGAAHDAEGLFNDPVFEGGIAFNLEKCRRCWFYWRHNSGWTEGPPWNDTPDPDSNRFGLEYRVIIWERDR